MAWGAWTRVVFFPERVDWITWVGTVVNGCIMAYAMTVFL
jgi:hypothetical protein